MRNFAKQVLVGPARFGADIAGRAGVAALDALLRWPYTEQAVDRVVGGPLVEIAARAAARHEVAERVASELLADGRAERLADQALESHAVERLAVRTFDSSLFDTVVERLLASEELWRVVDEVAHSPAVTDAIGDQGAGLAEEVAVRLRARSQHADARLERAARQAFRRRPRA